MPELRVGIIADDLTGAADSSAPFAQRGAQCAIRIIGNSYAVDSNRPDDMDVLSVSTCCRDLPSQEAVSRFSTALNFLCQSNPELLFWKVDSTLRGHLIEQREIIHKQFPDKTVVICPAFPQRGRKVVGGQLVAEGIRLDVAKAFGLRQCPEGSETYHSTFAQDLPEQPGQVVVMDAESEEDLDRIASYIVDQPHRFLPVGSAGLSTSIARRIWHSTPLSSGHQLDLTVVCIGSQHPVSRAQANVLRSHPETFHLPPVCSAEDILQARASNKRVVVWTSSDEQLFHMPELPSIASLSGSQRVHIIATGGNTAERICAQMSVNNLQVVSEIESGVALTSDAKSQFHLTLKSGAFGDTDLLLRLAGLEMQ